MARRLALLALLLPLAGCGALAAEPKDPEGATERIAATHVLRAGAAEHPPWVRIEGGAPRGLEPDLVRAFARSIGARVEWVVNGESPLLEGLEKQQLDIVVSGATAQTPWKKLVGVSQAYAKDQEGKRRVVFAATGENRLLLRLDRFVVRHKPELTRAAAVAETRP
ncbi:MAG: transporter substrate-binding domain-containing protein [Allosphingosinicella sp.]